MVDSAVEDKHILAQCRAKLFYSGELLEDIEKDAIIDQTESTIISVALLHQGCSILLYAKDDVQGKVSWLMMDFVCVNSSRAISITLGLGLKKVKLKFINKL